MLRFLWLAAFLATTLCHHVNAETHRHDVVIYGGTSAAVAAAVQVKRMGKSVVIVCPDQHLGGLTSGGLGWTDSGNKNAIGGISRDFYHRVWKHYQQTDAWNWEAQAGFGDRNQSTASDGQSLMWVFEPKVAEKIFEDLISENDIPVHRDQWLDRKSADSVVLTDGKIVSIKMLSGDIFQGEMFVDSTYEGDLVAKAGVDYHVGREANSVYDESFNGIQVGVLHHAHWFAKPVDPYRVPGDPSSGVLPRVSTEPPGKKGEGDHRLQAYCFRMCLTNHDENRIPFPKPEGYDAGEYELMLRVFQTGWRDMFRKFDRMPNHKTDTNNHGPFSTDNIGRNYDYPEADYDRRREIIREHEVYQKGLMYFMANDPRVPAEVSAAMSKWGLPKDEFKDNGGWPHQIYVREARRMIGDYVMTEHDCLDRKDTPHSIGMGSYTLDSHNTQRYIKPDGMVQNEGDIGVHTPRPYEIAYGSITPKREQCINLFSPVCVSSSHIAFGSIRMEPVFMILGQSAATAACLSIDRKIAVQDLAYADLQKRLLADGQVLEMDSPFAFNSNKMPGVIVDDKAAELTGNWKRSTANKGFVDAGYHHNDNKNEGTATASYQCELPAGKYEVRLSYPANNNRATNIPVVIQHAGGEALLVVNQRQKPPIDGLFQSLGEFTFNGTASVKVMTKGTDGYVVIDAIQFLPAE
ncbi:MAG: FAD-dependent oxidoreductase [Rubripirellula sp.]